MFIGHFALGFAAKRVVPRVQLAVLFAAAQLADLLWPLLLILGVEEVRIDPGNTAFTPLDFVSYPWSHSLLGLVLWGAAFGYIYKHLARDARPFLVLLALVLSHWALDFLTHRPDMPLYPSGPRFGLGLWNSIPATLAIEIPLYLAGLWIYVRTTQARDKTGRWSLWALVGFLILSYVAAFAGPPPPSLLALNVTSIVGGVVLLTWAWWVDAHREPSIERR